MRQCTRKQKIRIWESEHIRLALAFVLEIYPDRLKITRGTLGAMLKVALGGAAVFTVHVTAAGRICVPSTHRDPLAHWGCSGPTRQRSWAQCFLDGPVCLLETSPLWLTLKGAVPVHWSTFPCALHSHGVNYTAVFTWGSVRRASSTLTRELVKHPPWPAWGDVLHSDCVWCLHSLHLEKQKKKPYRILKAGRSSSPNINTVPR